MIAGIDYSTRFVDVVLLDEDTDAATWHRFELEGADAFDRARSVSMAVPGRAMSFWDDVLAVGIEEPRGWNPRTKRPMPNPDRSRVQGAVLACIPSARMVQPFLPMEWRKTVGLSGNASKEAVEDYVSARAFYTAGYCWPQDACDAYCIALATRMSVQVTA